MPADPGTCLPCTARSERHVPAGFCEAKRCGLPPAPSQASSGGLNQPPQLQPA